MSITGTFRTVIRDFIRWAVDDAQNIGREGDVLVSTAKNQSIGSDRGSGGLNFTVFNAIGGKVVQFSSYDPRTDRHYNAIYVVTDQEDLGEELGQIITKESLTR